MGGRLPRSSTPSLTVPLRHVRCWHGHLPRLADPSSGRGARLAGPPWWPPPRRGPSTLARWASGAARRRRGGHRLALRPLHSCGRGRALAAGQVGPPPLEWPRTPPPGARRPRNGVGAAGVPVPGTAAAATSAYSRRRRDPPVQCRAAPCQGYFRPSPHRKPVELRRAASTGQIPHSQSVTRSSRSRLRAHFRRCSAFRSPSTVRRALVSRSPPAALPLAGFN